MKVLLLDLDDTLIDTGSFYQKNRIEEKAWHK